MLRAVLHHSSSVLQGGNVVIVATSSFMRVFGVNALMRHGLSDQRRVSQVFMRRRGRITRPPARRQVPHALVSEGGGEENREYPASRPSDAAPPVSTCWSEMAAERGPRPNGSQSP